MKICVRYYNSEGSQYGVSIERSLDSQWWTPAAAAWKASSDGATIPLITNAGFWLGFHVTDFIINQMNDGIYVAYISCLDSGNVRGMVAYPFMLKPNVARSVVLIPDGLVFPQL